MRIGYLFNGYLADTKYDPQGNEVSTPDGNASYTWCIEHAVHDRNYRLIPLGAQRDAYVASTLGKNAFLAFSGEKRANSYGRMMRNGWSKLSDKKFPELDMVLIEWRWPIPGRNTPEDRGKPGFQDDLDRQTAVLRHYAGKCPIVVWDLDHKLTTEDRFQWGITRIIETSVRPRNGATRVHPPCISSELLQFPIDRRFPIINLGYIGSRYERDEVIDEWIKPCCGSKPQNMRARFWGKWEPEAEVRERWPGISFVPRIGIGGFREAYSRVAAVPLLAKRSYFECGFVTPRIAEAVLFGSIPVGLGPHLGIEEYVTKVAATPQELGEHAKWLKGISWERRDIIREEAAHRLSHTDARHFVDVLETMVR